MKIKIDFVTNSSSSSFIVIWPKKIESIDDVAKFINRKDFQEIIFRDAINKSSCDINSKAFLQTIVAEIQSGHVSAFDKLDYWTYVKKFCKREGIDEGELIKNSIWMNQMYEEMDKIRSEMATKYAEDFLKEYGKGHPYIFHYGDDDGGIFADLEHNNDWGGLPHIRVSHH